MGREYHHLDKMVEITRQQGSFHLRNYGIEPLPRGAVVDKNIVDIDAVSDALQDYPVVAVFQ